MLDVHANRVTRAQGAERSTDGVRGRQRHAVHRANAIAGMQPCAAPRAGRIRDAHPWTVARWLWSAHARGLIEAVDPQFSGFRARPVV